MWSYAHKPRFLNFNTRSRSILIWYSIRWDILGSCVGNGRHFSSNEVYNQASETQRPLANSHETRKPTPNWRWHLQYAKWRCIMCCPLLLFVCNGVRCKLCVSMFAVGDVWPRLLPLSLVWRYDCRSYGRYLVGHNRFKLLSVYGSWNGEEYHWSTHLCITLKISE